MPDVYDRIADSYISASQQVATLFPKPKPAPPVSPFADYLERETVKVPPMGLPEPPETPDWILKPGEVGDLQRPTSQRELKLFEVNARGITRKQYHDSIISYWQGLQPDIRQEYLRQGKQFKDMGFYDNEWDFIFLELGDVIGQRSWGLSSPLAHKMSDRYSPGMRGKIPGQTEPGKSAQDIKREPLDFPQQYLQQVAPGAMAGIEAGQAPKPGIELMPGIRLDQQGRVWQKGQPFSVGNIDPQTGEFKPAAWAKGLEVLSKGIELAFKPIRMLGTSIFAAAKATPEEREAGRARQEEIYRMTDEEIARAGFSSKAEMLIAEEPARQTKWQERFAELPWYQQVMYESPLWVAGGASGLTATGLRGALAPAAQAPKLAIRAPAQLARGALAPVAAVEAVPSFVLKQTVGRVTTKAFDKLMVAATRRELDALAKSMGITLPAATRTALLSQYKVAFRRHLERELAAWSSRTGKKIPAETADMMTERLLARASPKWASQQMMGALGKGTITPKMIEGVVDSVAQQAVKPVPMILDDLMKPAEVAPAPLRAPPAVVKPPVTPGIKPVVPERVPTAEPGMPEAIPPIQAVAGVTPPLPPEVTPPVAPPPAVPPITPIEPQLVMPVPPVKGLPTEEPLPLLPAGKVEAKAAIEAELYQPISDSPLDVPSTAYRKSGNFDEYIEKMPQFKKLSAEEARELGVAFRTTPAGRVLPAMRKSGFYVGEEFANYDKFVDVSLPSGTAQDPTRMMQNIQGGFVMGPVTKYITYPTRSTHLASLDFSDSQKYLYRGIIEKQGMIGDKKARQLAGDVIEHINRAEANFKTAQLLRKPEIQAIVGKLDKDTQKRIVDFAQATRAFFDDLLKKQNLARAKRNQGEINYLDNYRPWVIETNLWGKLMGQSQKPKTIMQSPVLPDYIKPVAPFNPRAMAREGGLAGYLKERDLQKLVYDYIDTAAKDIFNTNIIHNAKIHLATLRSMGYPNSATLIENWATEAYAGTPPAFTRAIRTLVPHKVVKPGLWVRRRLTSAVFPLNWTWNVFVQTSSGALTIMRYGITNSLKGLDYLFNSQAKAAVRTNAYSLIIKQRQAGKLAYQDIGGSTAKVRELEASKIETVEHYANFLTNLLEEKLTGVSVRAAYYDGVKKGYTGRELWEYASEGGAKTQSMYNLEDIPGVLRSKEVGALAPFQTFAFEVFNSVRELNIIGIRRIAGKAGAYESTSAKSATGKATISRRLKMIAEWVVAMVVINMYVDKVINRNPWSTSSFIPFFAALTGGVNAGNPWNMLLPLKYSLELKKGIDRVIKYGDWLSLRKWAIRYHMIGGVQLERMLEGIEAVIEGGVSDVTGKQMFEVRKEEAWKAILMGVYATEGGREYIDRLREKEGGLFKELTGIPLVQRTYYDKWRKDFREYEALETTKERNLYRERNPEIEAKFFIAGRFTTLKTLVAKQHVLRLMEEHNIKPEDVEGYEKVFGPIEPQQAKTPEATKWDEVRSSLSVSMLRGLEGLWYRGESLDPQVEAALKEVHQRHQLGQPDFNAWVKQVLRQAFENSVK